MFRVLISIFLIFLISCSNETSDCYGCDLKFLEWTTMDDDGYEWRMNAKAIVREYPWKINLTTVDEYGVPHDEIIPTKGDSIFIDRTAVVVKLYLIDNYSLEIEIRDFKTGEIIQPYPQDKIKWLEFSKEYIEEDILIESILVKSDYSKGYDEYSRVDLLSEATISRERIEVSVLNCDGEGIELSDPKIDCGFNLIYNVDEWNNYFIQAPLKNNRKLHIPLYEDDEEDKKNLPGVLD